jgi:predicted DCC family thiol-disulfide oxidoreductase YuxK
MSVSTVEPAPEPVLLFDGECGLCNGIVRLLLRTDQRGRLKFAPLQSSAAQAYLRAQGLPTEDFDSIVFVPDWNLWSPGAHRLRTDGALAAATAVGGVWRLITWMRILPGWLRDPFYKIVARTRYALFGQYRPSPLPRPEWSTRFL